MLSLVDILFLLCPWFFPPKTGPFTWLRVLTRYLGFWVHCFSSGSLLVYVFMVIFRFSFFCASVRGEVSDWDVRKASLTTVTMVASGNRPTAVRAPRHRSEWQASSSAEWQASSSDCWGFYGFMTYAVDSRYIRAFCLDRLNVPSNIHTYF